MDTLTSSASFYEQTNIMYCIHFVLFIIAIGEARRPNYEICLQPIFSLTIVRTSFSTPTVHTHGMSVSVFILTVLSHALWKQDHPDWDYIPLTQNDTFWCHNAFARKCRMTHSTLSSSTTNAEQQHPLQESVSISELSLSIPTWSSCQPCSEQWTPYQQSLNCTRNPIVLKWNFCHIW